MKRIISILTSIVLLVVSLATKAVELQVVTEDLAPFNYVSNGKVVGSNTLLIKHLLKSLNIKYTIKAYPWARSYQIALTQPNVLIYTINKTPHRERKFQWLGRFPLTTDISFFRLAKPLLVNTNFNDLKNLRIGTQINTANEQFLIQHNYKKISRVSHLRQTVGMLALGRIDVIIGSKAQIESELLAGGLPIDTVTHIKHAFLSAPSFALSKQSSPALAAKIREAYLQISTQDICHIMKLPPHQCIKPNSDALR